MSLSKPVTLDPRVKSWQEGLGVQQLWEVQERVIRVVGSGCDSIIQASSGQGRTSALLAGFVQKHLIEGSGSLRALILVPSEDLASRCHSLLEPLAQQLQGVPFTWHTVVKSHALQEDLEALQGRKTIVIGQPGRLAMLLKQRSMDLDDFDFVVLHEAYELLDERSPGVFREDILSLLSALPAPRRQRRRQKVIMTSKPLPSTATAGFTSTPVVTEVAMKGEPTMETVWSLFFRIPLGADEQAKVDVMWPLYSTLVIEQVVVYCADAASVERVRVPLAGEGFTMIVLYSHDGDARKQQALSDFRQCKVRLLITDIDVTAAPFPDLDAVDMVLHVNMPKTAEEFKHRSGRLGKGPRKRLAVSFVESTQDEDTLEAYQNKLGMEFMEVDEQTDALQPAN